MYGSWGAPRVTRGDDWAATARKTHNATAVTKRRTETSGGGEIARRTGPAGTTAVGKTGSGDVYAGHDGNVYRKEGDSWQKYGDGGWNDTNRPTPKSGEARTGAGTTARPTGADSATTGQLNRDSSARAEGAQRTRDAGSVNSGSSSRSGSYRPSGGGASRGGGGADRGGGGRRR